MKTTGKNLLATAGTVLATLLAAPAQTAEVVVADEQPAKSLLQGDLTLGLGHVSEDSYAFGRYNGLESSGVYPVAAVNLRFRPGLRPDYLRLTGRNLGTAARSLLLRYGRQGQYDLHLEYAQLPSFKIDSGQTPFEGVGTSQLTATALRGLDVETERRRLGAGVTYRPAPHLSLSIAARRETREGVDIIGGALGRLRAAGFGNPYGALLPEPVDYVDHQVDVRLGYVRQAYQWQLAYHASLFDNDNPSLTWDDPSAFGGPGTGAGPGAGPLADAGRLALPPSNQFHQVSFNGAYSLGDTTRLTGLLSTGVMLQDENFLPYRVGDTTAGLPRGSLDGEVYVHAARLGLTARPLPALRLKADYRYDERDNRTPQAAFDYFRLDSNVQPGAVTNQPLSYRKHRFGIDAGYRFTPRLQAGLEYGYRNTRREFSDVEQNQEHEVAARLGFKPRDNLDLALRAGRMERSASDYQAESPGQNPLTRKYYLADETQDKLGVTLSYLPHPQLTVGLGADWVRDDYHDTRIGLTDAERRAYNLDLSWVPRPDLVLHAFYTRERLESTQLGSADTLVAADWRAVFDDAIDTLGLGAKITGIRGKLDLGVDYVYMQGDGDVDLARAAATPVTQFPTLENELHSVRLYAAYRPRRNLELKLSVLHERFESTDWALDGNTVDAVNNVLVLGNSSPDYDANVVVGTVKVQF